MSIITITKDNFDSEVLSSDKTVIIDFWADWCMPCRMMAPVVDEIAGERSDIIVGKINVDDEPELAAKFGISSIPTIVAVKSGTVSAQSIGVKAKQAILDMI